MVDIQRLTRFLTRFLYPCFMNSNIFLHKMNHKGILKFENICEGYLGLQREIYK
jgi:hypothetical protein